jgi:RNA polymerase sigma-70 factor (ECF subfamily)
MDTIYNEPRAANHETTNRFIPPFFPQCAAQPAPLRALGQTGRVRRQAGASRSDADLVDRLKSGDETALTDLLEQHGDKIYGIARRYLREEQDIRDVMQEVLITVWTKIESFQERAAFTSWLYRVTANAALMTVRRLKRREREISRDALPADEVVEELRLESRPSDRIERLELGQMVQSAIDRLPEPYRTTLVLSDLQEHSMEEVAGLTGVTIQAVKSRLHRARLKVRELVLPYLRHGLAAA